ncbi:MAG TPA: hypothetical protein VM223_08070 [Planctomycetota bacterium]|nr:hypothetical protein [Planctomycetota bacterium]
MTNKASSSATVVVGERHPERKLLQLFVGVHLHERLGLPVGEVAVDGDGGCRAAGGVGVSVCHFMHLGVFRLFDGKPAQNKQENMVTVPSGEASVHPFPSSLHLVIIILCFPAFVSSWLSSLGAQAGTTGTMNPP